MPVLKRPDAEIHYEVHGSGFPLLLFANGGVTRSRIVNWREGHDPKTGQKNFRMNPMVELADRFTVVAMDQRNAGASTGALKASHGWHTYAEDHLALMDHLGHRRFHLMGVCIGGSFIFKLCQMTPDRVAAAVVQQPIGMHNNRPHWFESVQTLGATVRARDPSVTEQDLEGFAHNLFDTDFVFSVDRDFVRSCKTPLLLQPGSDSSHPKEVSADIANLAQNIEVQTDWRGPEHLAAATRKTREFLIKHTP
jgi:pimeloyl-ACP methyl ester carboxylesterase